LGSFLPAYFIGRAKGVDIRKVGSGNPGTMNTYHQLGLPAAVVTALYDALKGLASMGIAYALHAPTDFIYLAGLFAIVGHIFPFYLGFRGGQGAAASVGMLLGALILLLKNGWLPLVDLAFLAGLTLALYVVFRRGSVIGPVVLPLLSFFVFLNCPSASLSWFFAALAAHITVVNIYLDYRDKPKVKLKPETTASIKHLRVLLRPAAISFPLLYLVYPRRFLLLLVGGVTCLFILIDILRLSSSRLNLLVFRWLHKFFREKERQTFSSATLFLVSSFLVILLFDKALATLSIVFLVFGDLSAKFTGLEHGRWHLFGKSLDGTLAYLATSLVFGYLWSLIVPVPFFLVVIGATVAALAELLPLGVNDNFVVPLVSAAAMRAVQILL
jgi:glycerol-3-phosphate acyltransferase PlsY